MVRWFGAGRALTFASCSFAAKAIAALPGMVGIRSLDRYYLPPRSRAPN